MNTQSDQHRVNRLVMRNATSATLASLQEDDGTPYASLVNIATDAAGWPILLISTLAWHTRNLAADARASVLFTEPGEHADALQGARITVLGRFVRCDDPAVRTRYLALHVPARAYASFGDFAIWRMEPERLHAVAGFGRIESMSADDVMLSRAASDAFQDFDCSRAKLPDIGSGRVTSIDPDGFFLESETGVRRVNFDTAQLSPETACTAIREGEYTSV